MGALITFMMWLTALVCGWVDWMDTALFLPIIMLMASQLFD